MSAVPVVISGVLADKYGRTLEPVTLAGMATIAGLGVGGGPIMPPEQGSPPGIWGGAPLPWPTPPIHYPPSIWPSPGHPAHPIVLPPEQVPPEMKPPTPPAPGTVTPVPPPAGSGGWPVTGMVPPPYVVMYYPGFGPVIVAAPPVATPAKK